MGFFDFQDDEGEEQGDAPLPPPPPYEPKNGTQCMLFWTKKIVTLIVGIDCQMEMYCISSDITITPPFLPSSSFFPSYPHRRNGSTSSSSSSSKLYPIHAAPYLHSVRKVREGRCSWIPPWDKPIRRWRGERGNGTSSNVWFLQGRLLRVHYILPGCV